MLNGLSERGGRAAVDLAERRREVAVAGEAEVESERGEVVVLREQVQRPRETQPEMIAIERQALDLLEHLREIHR